MIAADQKDEHLHQSSPRWDGYVNLYIHRYGPEWTLEEWYWVYFNPEGNAVKIEYTLIKNKYIEIFSVNLEKKTIGKD